MKLAIYTLEHAVGIGAYANQGWSFLEVAQKNDGRSQQVQQE